MLDEAASTFKRKTAMDTFRTNMLRCYEYQLKHGSVSALIASDITLKGYLYTGKYHRDKLGLAGDPRQKLYRMFLPNTQKYARWRELFDRYVDFKTGNNNSDDDPPFLQYAVQKEG